MTEHPQLTVPLGLTGLGTDRDIGLGVCITFGLNVGMLANGAFSSLTCPLLLNSCLLPTAVKVWGMAYFGR